MRSLWSAPFDTQPGLLFQFRLAMDLGKSVKEIREMNAWELMMWANFYQREHQAIDDMKAKH